MEFRLVTCTPLLDALCREVNNVGANAESTIRPTSRAPRSHAPLPLAVFRALFDNVRLGAPGLRRAGRAAHCGGDADAPLKNSATTARSAAWLAPICVGLVTFIAFIPALRNGFVSWDDDKNFLANPHYRGLGLDQLSWMWTTFHMGHYIPLTWMTLGLDYLLWGMNPRGYHLTDRKSTRLNSSHLRLSRMPSSA